MTVIQDLARARAELRRAVAELLDAGAGAVPLLAQLREEVAASSSGKGGGAGRAHSPVPIAPDALDLLTTIERSAARNLWSAEAVHSIGGTLIETAPIAMPVETRVRRTAAYLLHREGEPDRIEYVARLLRYWAEQIRSVVSPEVHALAAPCPVCAVQWVVRESAGETVRAAALIYQPGIGAACLSCGHSWPSVDMDRLATEATERQAAEEEGHAEP